MPIALVTLILSLSMLSQTKTSKLDAPTAIDKVRYATVLIEARYDGYQHARLGTGFLVSASGFVITNKHVVDAIPPGGQLIVEFRMPNQSTGRVTMNESFVGEDSTVVDLDADNDLALIKTRVPVDLERAFQFNGLSPKPAPVTVVDFMPDMPREGERILVSGYPLNLSALESQEGMVASQTFRYTMGLSFQYVGDKNASLLLVNIPINHGNSGGPVYLPTTGRVVGVAEGFLTTQVEETDKLHVNSGTGCVIPAKYVLNLMKKNGVKK